MKLELEIPDWAGDMEMYIFSSIELVAFKPAGKNWHVKTGRCHQCGKCCGLGKPDLCEHLYERAPGDWQCNYGIMRPFACCACNLPIPEGCTEKLEEIK